MNESVNQIHVLLEAAERNFAGMEQRMSLCDSLLDAKFRDTDEALTNAGNMMDAAQLRAEEAFSKVQVLETEIGQIREADPSLCTTLEAKVLAIVNSIKNHSGDNHNKRDLLDPKNMTVSKFEGDKKDFEAWRTNVKIICAASTPTLIICSRTCAGMSFRSAKKTCKQR